MARKFLDRDDPFFTAPWRRWAVTLLPLAWGLFELYLNQPFWAILFLTAGAYAAWELILRPEKDK